MKNSIIQMESITKIYTIGEQRIYALDHVYLTIDRGEFVSIVGPSGSGKTTLMNIIGCLDVADSGEYILDHQNIRGYSEAQLAKIRNREIGFVFQNFNLIARLTAEQNVELPLIYQRVPQSKRERRVRDALNLVGLLNREQHKPSELSGGQQQRVAIARALVTNPAILLADEPTGNLDSKTGHDILNLFRELHQAGNTIVMITHNEKIASQAERSMRIDDGQLGDN